jgi:hypothetical protein
VTWTVGSSTAPTIVGHNPWGSPVRVWLEALGRLDRGASEDTPATARGSMLEYGIGTGWARREGWVAIPGPTFDDPPALNPEYPWLHSRVDFYVWRPAAGGPAPYVLDSVADVKTSHFLEEEIELPDGRRVPGWGEPGTDHVPKWVKTQMLVHLAIHPWAPRCYVPALGTVRDDFRVYVIEREAHRQHIDRLVHAVDVWIRTHVLGQVAPKADGSQRTTDALALGLRASKGALLAATPALAAMVDAATRKRATRTVLDREIERMRQEVQIAMGDATELVDERGELIATFRPGKDGRRRFRLLSIQDDDDNPNE